MDPTTPSRTDLLSTGTPTFVLALMVVAFAALWWAGHKFSRLLPGKLPAAGGFVVRILIGMLCLWSLWQFLSRFMVLETTWSLLTNAFIGGAAMEIIFSLYRLERGMVTPATGRTLLTLRLLAVAAVLFILVQPVRTWDQSRKIERNVVVLIDDSESMQIVDKQMTATEKLQLATFAGVPAAAKRAPLPPVLDQVRAYLPRLSGELENLRVPDNYGSDAEKTLLDRRREAVGKLLAEGLQLTTAATSALETAKKDEGNYQPEGRSLLSQTLARFHDALPAELRAAADRLKENRIPPVRERVEKTVEGLRQAVEAVQSVILAADEATLKTISEPDRQAIEKAAFIPRAQIAHDALTRAHGGSKPFLDQLKDKYDIKLVRFGKTPAPVTSPDFPAGGAAPEFRMRTDVTRALDEALQKVPAESLAGVLLLSDGRHNMDKPADDAARSLGIQGSPLHAVEIGSAKGPRDVAFLGVTAPESIYLGDRIKIKADVKADGMKGGQVKLTLSSGDKVLQEQTIPVPEETFQTSVKMAFTPTDKGTAGYTLKLEQVEGELFKDNNQWDFEVAVSDDRTNVLIIDSYPRWEFRYLRNLFYGRDKSVHLQYVLLNPDEIKNQDAVPAVPASASRKFGDAEATRLPENKAEWSKFDVIILGDVPPASLSAETWDIIEKCVSERGALLTVIAGPRSMPHAFSSEIVRKLLPVEFQPSSTADFFKGPEESFRLRLTAEGRSSPVLAQSPSQMENVSIWAQMPALQWRHPITRAREGSAVLAYAETGRMAAPVTNAEQGLNQFATLKKQQSENALIVTGQYGLGKVAWFGFDQTWRLRYGIGDAYHHRLWGNLLRWGAGENLRAGTGSVRLGTDRLAYETGDKIKILARLSGEGFKPTDKASVFAQVYDADNKLVSKRQLRYRESSNGMYEAEVDPLVKSGRYRVELTGSDVEKLLKTEGKAEKVETHFKTLTTTNPVELGDLSLDRAFLNKATSLASGKVVDITRIDQLASAFGPESKSLVERKESTLWDNWILLVAALGLLTAEWIIRRRGGLA